MVDEPARPLLPLVSLLMPVRNETKYIERGLAAVFAQTYPAERLEIIVADGMSTDGTRERLEKLREGHPGLRVVDNPAGIVPTGLNAALPLARGDIVIRVDGHCEIAPDYVERCVAHLQRREADAVGGSVTTVGETPVARAIALAMSSPFGVGGSAFRTLQDRTLLVDTVPFPAYTREALERAGPFDEELVRNQDDEYNYRLRKLGGRVLLAADVRSLYYSRSSWTSLARQYFQYGYWKVRVLQKHPRQMRWRQFAPPVFVAALLGTAAAAPWSAFAAGSLLLLLLAYAAASLAATLGQARRAGLRRLPLLPFAFAVLHLAYGAGFVVGLIRFWRRWGEDEHVAPERTLLDAGGRIGPEEQSDRQRGSSAEVRAGLR